MSEKVMTLDSPFTKEAFQQIDAEKLTIAELADRIRKGDRACMMRMYTILHDDLCSIAQKTIENAKQVEFLVRKSFAEVFYDHENIDPDVFELHLLQVLDENTHKMSIRNTYTSALLTQIVLKPQEDNYVKSELAYDGGAVSVASDYADVSDLVEEKEDRKDLSKTSAIPLILGATAAISTLGAGVQHIQNEHLRKQKAQSYEEMMAALQISFETNTDGSDITNFEYSANLSQATSSLVKAYEGGVLSTSTEAIPLNKVGSTIVTYSLSQTDSFAQLGRKSVTKTYTVTDTKAPQITTGASSYRLTVGDTFDPHSVVSSVVDPADGGLMYVESAPAPLENDALGRMYETGWYTVESSVDTSKEGEYNVLIHASDNHGNVTETSVDVIVKAKAIVNNVSVTGSVAVNTAENANLLYSLLTNQYGFTKAAASAIMANAHIESTFNPTAGTAYYGLFQWGGSRRSNLVAFCAANGYSSDSVEGQVAFAVSEMGGMRDIMNSVADSAQGAAEAGVYFRQNFERSAGLNNVANIAASYYNSL